MPTQLEVDYWRDRKQRLNFDKFYIANALALVTHSLVSSLLTPLAAATPGPD